MLKIILVLISFAITGCIEQITEPVEVTINKEFKIRAGESVYFKEGKATITFSKVITDSRCPKGVTCLWAGDAAILLQVTTDKDQISDTLHSYFNHKSLFFSPYKISFKSLDPYPEGSKKNVSEYYTAALIITHSGEGDQRDFNWTLQKLNTFDFKKGIILYDLKVVK